MTCSRCGSAMHPELIAPSFTLWRDVYPMTHTFRQEHPESREPGTLRHLPFKRPEHNPCKGCGTHITDTRYSWCRPCAAKGLGCIFCGKAYDGKCRRHGGLSRNERAKQYSRQYRAAKRAERGAMGRVAPRPVTLSEFGWGGRRPGAGRPRRAAVALAH